MISRKNILLVSVSFLATSCTTVEIKNPGVKTTTAAAIVTPSSPISKKKGKRIAGNTTDVQITKQAQEPEKLIQVNTQASLTEQLQQMVYLSTQAPEKSERDNYRHQAIEVVEAKLNEIQLEEVISNPNYGFIRGQAMYRLAERALDEKNSARAKKLLSDLIEFQPQGEFTPKAQKALSNLINSQNVKPTTIGAILPLTGKNSAIGQRALRGIEMGLGLNEPGSPFKLAVIDSEGNPDTARRGVEKLTQEDNVIAIVGSLLSKTAPAVATRAHELGVPSIALSQKTGLTEIGPTVFRNSLTSQMQVRYLVRTAIDDLGMKKFAILYPNDPYGVEYANIFWDEVLARGGEVTAVQNYSVKETDFRLVIQRLIGTYYGEARQAEFNFRTKELLNSDKRKSARSEKLEAVLPPITDFDGIFIPDSAKSMGQIAAMLAFNDVRNVKLMGTNLWNTPGLAKRSGSFMNNILFVDSLQLTPKEEPRFITDYKRLYKEPASLIEIQAYDSSFILKELILEGADDREKLTQKLSELRKFPGSLGPLNVNSDREIERPLLPMTIDKGEIVILKKPKMNTL